jgi:antitoxin (DNA-binding transcriptional repressor) of toxin-antitoxin stability system
MKTATAADLRNNFRRVSQWIKGGESVRITKHGAPFATLKPEPAQKKKKIAWPDLKARRERIFPDGPPPGKPISEIVDEGRGDY